MMSQSSPKKILVVDDEKEVVEYLSSILQRANYEVISTTQGKQALDLAFEHKPDLIILDVLIPDLRGEEIYRLLSENAETADIPIIFLTGIITEEDESFIQNLTGRSRLLAKPTTKEKILDAIHKTLEDHDLSLS
ncbi:MAG: response regulator [Candidatus Omnitrophica bacterium]|nr:response regulator [Candidatus Omnitrophota bacterium]